MKEVIYISSNSVVDMERITTAKKVAGYCRVSHVQDDQYSSLENQISNARKMIDSNPFWINAGIYSEQGSGRSMKNRTELKKLLAKCRKGKVDIIITKSVSRLSRNTLDLVKICYELKSKGIDVWFENENMKLLDANTMLILETYAAITQEENRSKSEDIKWGIRQGFAEGTSGYNNFICYGYVKTDNGLEIDKNQAKNIRLIFKLRLNGKSLSYISKELHKRKIPSPTGKEIWSRETINKLLKNEKLCGNILLQKTYVEDYLLGKQVENKGELQKVIIKNNHKGIISKDVFNKVNCN